MKFNENLLIMFLFLFSGGKQWLGWGIGFGFALFNSKSSSAKTTNNTTTNTSVGASEDSIASGRDIYMQDPGIVDAIKTVSANTQAIAAGALSQAGKQFDDASRLANANTNKDEEMMKLAGYGILAYAAIKLAPNLIQAFK